MGGFVHHHRVQVACVVHELMPCPCCTVSGCVESRVLSPWRDKVRGAVPGLVAPSGCDILRGAVSGLLASPWCDEVRGAVPGLVASSRGDKVCGAVAGPRMQAGATLVLSGSQGGWTKVGSPLPRRHAVKG